MRSSRRRASGFANCRFVRRSWSDHKACLMTQQISHYTRIEPLLRSLARIMLGFTFLLHGLQKWFGMFGGLGGQTPPLTSMLGAAGVIETIGATLIILGI